MRSLKVRLVLWSLLWTAGLVAVMNVGILTLMRHRIAMHVIHYGALAAGAMAILLAGLFHLRNILAPFKRLRAELAAVRAGASARVEGAFPAEVAPLVADLNELLAHRAGLVTRAIARAGDLAHGLKTPLAVIGQEAERLAAAGQAEPAAIIGREVERLRRQVDVHLAHARAAASGATPGANAQVLESAAGLARTLARLYLEKGVTIDLAVSPAHAVRVEREDLDEMLGNLLDNACKWARSHIRVASAESGAGVFVEVEDDGPGIPAALRERALERGVRVDEAAPGTGFGLAIARDLAELYGGSLELGASPLGGLAARLTLPASRGADTP